MELWNRTARPASNPVPDPNGTTDRSFTMFQRLTAAALAAGVLALAGASGLAQPEKKADPAKAKKALQEVQDFIGLWNLEGTQKVGAKTEAWKEKVNWGWKFKDGDAWIRGRASPRARGKYFSPASCGTTPTRRSTC
jgi:hypothetical protein